jgi:hypothetical protein
MGRFALLLVSFLAAGTAWAGPPLAGVYPSTDLGGPLLIGHATESWAPPGGGGQVGNTVNAAAWDGSRLGLQWRVYCVSIAAPPQLIEDTVGPDGTGQRTFVTHYAGGWMWFAGDGPWGNGESEYRAQVDTYTDITTFNFVGGEVVGSVSNISISGHFIGFPGLCCTFAIANATGVGATDFSDKPAGYPDFLEPGTCAATRVYGGWADVTGITLSIIHCEMPTDRASWGVIKTLYE